MTDRVPSIVRRPCLTAAAAFVVFCVLAAVTCPLRASAGDKYIIVKKTGIDKTAEYVILGVDDAKQLQKDMALQAKDWKADEANKGVPFPSAKLGQPKFEVKDQLTNAEEAQKKLEAYVAHAEKQDGRDVKKSTKMTERDKKKEEEEADKARVVEAACGLVEEKLEELVAKEKEKAGGAKPAGDDAGAGGDDAPADPDKALRRAL
jgi:hypothetical protein